MTTFAELGLAPDILRALDELGYATPTPIQAQVIPLALHGGDILGAAQTGTGKTAAFALPLIQRLLPFANTSTSPAKHPIRALILTPTRELAIQVEESIKAYCKHVPVRSLVVYGGVNINTQIPILKTGIEILVATPGRLLDHVQNKTLLLTQVNTLVLDEADRMLDMGFMPDLKRIVALLPTQRVNMMFSATFPEEIRKLADSILNNPTFIEVARNETAVTVTQLVVHPVHHERKRQLLAHLIKSRDLRQVLVFTGTKLGCNRLANELNRAGIHADAIHGDKTQQERIKALDAFKAGSIRVLVATDVAARGIDRHRHRGAALRRELRPAAQSGGLRPSHRPHRPRRGQRRGHLAGQRGREPLSARHREAHRQRDRARDRPRIRAWRRRGAFVQATGAACSPGAADGAQAYRRF